MSAGFEARIAEVLREHRKSWYLQSGVATCLGCDWSKFGTAKVTGDLHTAHAASVVAALFTQERELLSGPTWDSIGDGISISGDGVKASVDCHLCEVTMHGFSPREAFDHGLEPAQDKHGIVPKYRSRWVSSWETT